MRVLVCGGRDYADETRVNSFLDDIHQKHWVDRVIQGGARGADRLAYQWCVSRSIECWNVPANWDRDGKAAGPIRNQRMIDEGNPDICIAFPGGIGTADMIRRARKAGIEVIEVKA